MTTKKPSDAAMAAAKTFMSLDDDPCSPEETIEELAHALDAFAEQAVASEQREILRIAENFDGGHEVRIMLRERIRSRGAK